MSGLFYQCSELKYNIHSILYDVRGKTKFIEYQQNCVIADAKFFT